MKNKISTNKETQDIKAKEVQALKDAVQEIALLPSGITVLKYLKKVCGFGIPTPVRNTQTGEISTIDTLYNTAMQNVYLSLRQYMNDKTKIKIEF